MHAVDALDNLPRLAMRKRNVIQSDYVQETDRVHNKICGLSSSVELALVRFPFALEEIAVTR